MTGKVPTLFFYFYSLWLFFIFIFIHHLLTLCSFCLVSLALSANFHSRIAVSPPLSPLSYLLVFLHLLSIDAIGKFNQKNCISFPSPINCSTYSLLMQLANSVRKIAFLLPFPINCSTYILLMKLANSIRKIAFLSLPFSNKLFHLHPVDEIGKFNQKNCISLPSLLQ